LKKTKKSLLYYDLVSVVKTKQDQTTHYIYIEFPHVLVKFHNP